MTRREIIALSLPVIAAAQSPTRRLKVVCVGGHPDDPKSGGGGTLARQSAAGHEVTVVYLAAGVRGTGGRRHGGGREGGPDSQTDHWRDRT